MIAILALATAGGAAAVWLRTDPLAFTKAHRLASAMVARAAGAAIRIHDPYAAVEGSPSCNCSSAIEYRCADPTHPYYERVRRDPRLAALAALPPHRLATYARYMDFLRDQFPHGTPSTWAARLPGYHLLERLDDAERGERFLCRDISIMLSQLVGAHGGYARLVSLLSARGDGHVVTELWIEEAEHGGRWVMFDPDYNVWFSGADGTPLSALDLHRLLREERFDAIEAHPGSSQHTLYDPVLHRFLVGLYAAISFSGRANWLRADYPGWHPRRHPTAREYLWQQDEILLPRLYYRDVVSDEEQIYFRPCRPWLERGSPPSDRGEDPLAG